jgi:hypothetical protein
MAVTMTSSKMTNVNVLHVYGKPGDVQILPTDGLLRKNNSNSADFMVHCLGSVNVESSLEDPHDILANTATANWSNLTTFVNDDYSTYTSLATCLKLTFVTAGCIHIASN